MKLSTKIFLPIILISALLILLNGCFGVPTDESPGYTPGTITGIIASPCCSTSAEPVSETSGSPEYWCYYCQETWSLQDGIEVVLTYGEDEIATTSTNQYGEFTFTNVSPGKNYVITAYCPDFDDNRPLVKDVALELIEGGSFDTKITDLVSTSLGLVVDFLVLYTEWGPEDISLDEVIADKPGFPNFPDFKALIYEVRRVVENCGNVNTDDDVQEALCLAAEEISKLDIGCAPGFTPLPGPGPTPGPCDGNVEPDITDVTLDGESIESPEYLIVGAPYIFCVYATDDDILSQELTYSLTIDDGINPPFNVNIGTNSDGFICYSEPLLFEYVGTYEVTVNVDDGCGDITTWEPVTVEVDCPELSSLTLNITVPDPLCQDACATINSATVSYNDATPDLVITDLTKLTWSYDSAEIDFTPGTGAVCLATGADPGTYTINATYEDECGATVSSTEVGNIPFVLCCPVLEKAEIDIDTIGPLCQDDCATISSVTITHADGDSVIAYDDDDLEWVVPTGISFDPASSDQVCLTEDPVLGGKAYTIEVTYTDECGETVVGSVDVTFELCCPVLEKAEIDIDTIGPLCQDDCATISSVTITHADGDSVIAYDDDDLEWVVPTGISFDPASSDQVCLTEDPVLGGKAYTIEVTYTDECGETVVGSVDVTFELCCPALQAAVIDIDTIGPLCQDECATISSVTVTHADGTSVIAYDDDDLEWTVPAGISFDPDSSDQVCLTEDPVLGGKAYTIEVTYTDECGETVVGSVDVTFELCCLIPELSDLSFKIKMQGVWTEFITAFSPGITSYDLSTNTSGAPKFEFIATDGCGTLKLEFNWYRGYNCGDSWLVNDPLTAETWYDAEHLETLNIPGWREIVSGGLYPPNNENTLCEHGGNILLIKVTASDGSASEIYRIDVLRAAPTT